MEMFLMRESCTQNISMARLLMWLSRMVPFAWFQSAFCKAATNISPNDVKRIL